MVPKPGGSHLASDWRSFGICGRISSKTLNSLNLKVWMWLGTAKTLAHIAENQLSLLLFLLTSGMPSAFFSGLEVALQIGGPISATLAQHPT